MWAPTPVQQEQGRDSRSGAFDGNLGGQSGPPESQRTASACRLHAARLRDSTLSENFLDFYARHQTPRTTHHADTTFQSHLDISISISISYLFYCLFVFACPLFLTPHLTSHTLYTRPPACNTTCFLRPQPHPQPQPQPHLIAAGCLLLPGALVELVCVCLVCSTEPALDSLPGAGLGSGSGSSHRTPRNTSFACAQAGHRRVRSALSFASSFS